MKNENIKKLTTYLFFLTLNLIVINIVLFNNFFTVNSIQVSNSKDVINKTIMEFNELDLQHLCVVINCHEIGFINGQGYELIDGTLKKSKK